MKLARRDPPESGFEVWVVMRVALAEFDFQKARLRWNQR